MEALRKARQALVRLDPQRADVDPTELSVFQPALLAIVDELSREPRLREVGILRLSGSHARIQVSAEEGA